MVRRVNAKHQAANVLSSLPSATTDDSEHGKDTVYIDSVNEQPQLELFIFERGYRNENQ